MVDTKSAFGFDKNDVERWDARETGQALAPILAKVGRITPTEGNTDQLVQALEADPDAIAGIAHLNELMRARSKAR